ncbi:SoxR reducing system RseC family protein [candidate division KSB1 bacterium]
MENIKKYGFVVSISGDIAYICLQDSTECSDNCSKKHTCGVMRNGFIETDRSDDSIIAVHNTVNTIKGKRVEVSIADRTLSGYAFLLFILPLILISLGALLAYYIIPIMLSWIIGGIIGLSLSIFINHTFNKRVKKKYKISRILS